MSGEQVVTVKGVEFTITTEHAASSYGQPVVVGPDGQALGAADLYDTGDGLVSGAEIFAAAAQVAERQGAGRAPGRWPRRSVRPCDTQT